MQEIILVRTSFFFFFFFFFFLSPPPPPPPPPTRIISPARYYWTRLLNNTMRKGEKTTKKKKKKILATKYASKIRSFSKVNPFHHQKDERKYKSTGIDPSISILEADSTKQTTCGAVVLPSVLRTATRRW